MVLVNQPPARDALTRFVTHRLAEQAISLVGVPARLDPALPLAELLRAQPVILPNAESLVRAAFDTLTRRLGLTPQIAAEVDDMAMMRLLARAGVGLALVPPVVVQDELAAGTLVEAREHPAIFEAFYAVTLDRRFPNPVLKDLLAAF